MYKLHGKEVKTQWVLQFLISSASWFQLNSIVHELPHLWWNGFTTVVMKKRLKRTWHMKTSATKVTQSLSFLPNRKEWQTQKRLLEWDREKKPCFISKLHKSLLLFLSSSVKKLLILKTKLLHWLYFQRGFLKSTALRVVMLPWMRRFCHITLCESHHEITAHREGGKLFFPILAGCESLTVAFMALFSLCVFFYYFCLSEWCW